MKIDYVTGNAGKFQEACHILEGWQLKQVALDLDEIQGERHQIVRDKARRAVRILNKPLIVEDVSVCCPALGGLPGPYIKEFLAHLGPEGLAELILKHSDHTAQVICTVGYISPSIEPVCFEGIQEGVIVKPRGGTAHGLLSWNGIFQPKGSRKTYGELTLKEISRISMRRQALLLLKDYLCQSEI